MTEIKACLFDMGKVLVHFSHDVMLEQMAVVCGCEAAELKTLLFDSGLLLEYERGLHDEPQMHSNLETALKRQLDRLQLEDAAARIFEPNEEMIPLLLELRDAGIPLVLLSNTSRIHFEFIRNSFSILEHFDHFILSYEVQALKPDPAIYAHAVQAAGVSAEECFFTDDIMENIIAARACGIEAHLFEDAVQIRKVLHGLGLPISEGI
ncbi:HAD family phosphatase [Rubinisphaera sp.]|uniref:HAD family hydrolase n=1 Tax=Rubinisphaera sp. TaxID=2024857 RepID=UPI000C0C7F70|nr:HAD family phosphatase [Rubinisphaera sp.]MBV11145.1 haloacid dehalogenase [Rubinisphaera sp.]HCS53821.1 HAD family phosphatase [Planctomycetaceae bacterium]|tara:strand:- start:110 stop:733 length:624 start_codon:yes stop_codon:yes gene_type:complete